MKSRRERTANARGACGARLASLLSGLAPSFLNRPGRSPLTDGRADHLFSVRSRSSLRAIGAAQQRKAASRTEHAKNLSGPGGSRLHAPRKLVGMTNPVGNDGRAHVSPSRL
jgi:hypothetical protein